MVPVDRGEGWVGGGGEEREGRFAVSRAQAGRVFIARLVRHLLRRLCLARQRRQKSSFGRMQCDFEMQRDALGHLIQRRKLLRAFPRGAMLGGSDNWVEIRQDDPEGHAVLQLVQDQIKPGLPNGLRLWGPQPRLGVKDAKTSGECRLRVQNRPLEDGAAFLRRD